MQLPSFYPSSLQGTKFARYIEISNIFICLRGFLLFFRCFSLLTPFLDAQRKLPMLSTVRLPQTRTVTVTVTEGLAGPLSDSRPHDKIDRVEQESDSDTDDFLIKSPLS